MDITFKYTDGKDCDFINLCYYLDDFLNKLAGGVQNRLEYVPLNSLEHIHDVIIAYNGTIPIGCVSFKRYSEDTVEIKRLFVKGEYRNQGIARNMMKILEKHIKQKGYLYCVLETGYDIIAAMALYESIGYKIIPNYEPYVKFTESVCMKKRL